MRNSFGIYLGAYKALHPKHNLVYQDINGKRDIPGDMLSINLSPYDYVIATPPCNFWSKARGNRCSLYSLNTKHLLPDIIDKLVLLGKPFIVENVRNDKRMFTEGVLPRNDCIIYYIGRHIYFTNVPFKNENVEILQRQDFRYGGKVILYDDMNNKEHQGGFNVHNVIEAFINYLEESYEK